VLDPIDKRLHLLAELGMETVMTLTATTPARRVYGLLSSLA
jgi:hypothetical protein